MQPILVFIAPAPAAKLTQPHKLVEMVDLHNSSHQLKRIPSGNAHSLAFMTQVLNLNINSSTSSKFPKLLKLQHVMFSYIGWVVQ